MRPSAAQGFEWIGGVCFSHHPNGGLANRGSDSFENLSYAE